VHFYTENGRFAVLSLLWGLIGTAYNVHLRLIGKRVVDFLIELILLGVTAEATTSENRLD